MSERASRAHPRPPLRVRSVIRLVLPTLLSKAHKPTQSDCSASPSRTSSSYGRTAAQAQLWDGSTENKTGAAHLLADLVHRGLDVEQGVLVVLDGSKALRAAVNEVFGPVPFQRCVRHKERGVLDHLPERNRPAVKARLRRVWASDNHALALDGLRRLASDLDHSHPGAAASLREGLEETLTLTQVGIRGRLKRTLESTNPCESRIEFTHRTSRNVKRWQSVDMCLRLTAAGMLDAGRQFRKIIGYADLAKLANAVERDLAARRAPVFTGTTHEGAARRGTGRRDARQEEPGAVWPRAAVLAVHRQRQAIGCPPSAEARGHR